MKNTTKLMLASAMLASSSAAMAELTFSANAAITSNYIFRGVSQTDNSPAIQGGFDMEHSSGFYAGIWGSNVDSDFYAGAEAEFDLYVGFSGEFPNTKLGYDVGILGYQYPDTTFNDNNTEEVYGSLSYDFGPAAATVGLAYSDDWFGTDDALYAYIDVDVPLPREFSLGLHYGHEDFDNLEDYGEWKVSLARSFGGFDFSLDYTDTDIDEDDVNAAAPDKLSDDKIVFTVSKSF